MPITQRSKKRRMGRPAVVLPLVLALLLSPVSLFAQRGGGRGGRGTTTSAPKGGVPETDDMKNFKRALALQATEPQIALFQILAKDMGTAKEKVGDLAKHPERTREQAGILAYVVENARDESHDFLRGLSDTQKSGLKAWKKKVEKADSDVSKRWKALAQDIAREKVDGKRMTADAEKLSEALEKSLTEQWRLVGKMGIQPPPDGNHTGDGGAGDPRSTTAGNAVRCYQIGASVSDPQITALLWAASNAAFLMTIVVRKHFNFGDVADAANKVFWEYGQQSMALAGANLP